MVPNLDMLYEAIIKETATINIVKEITDKNGNSLF